MTLSCWFFFLGGGCFETRPYCAAGLGFLALAFFWALSARQPRLSGQPLCSAVFALLIDALKDHLLLLGKTQFFFFCFWKNALYFISILKGGFTEYRILAFVFLIISFLFVLFETGSWSQSIPVWNSLCILGWPWALGNPPDSALQSQRHYPPPLLALPRCPPGFLENAVKSEKVAVHSFPWPQFGGDPNFQICVGATITLDQDDSNAVAKVWVFIGFDKQHSLLGLETIGEPEKSGTQTLMYMLHGSAVQCSLKQIQSVCPCSLARKARSIRGPTLRETLDLGGTMAGTQALRSAEAMRIRVGRPGWVRSCRKPWALALVLHFEEPPPPAAPICG